MAIITSSTIPLSAYPVVQKVIDMMQRDFGFSLKNRLVVIPEVEKFRIKEDESITNQVKTGKYEYDVYFDGEYVSSFSIMDHPQRVRIGILEGLKNLIKQNKIFWDVKKYDELEEKKKQEKRDKKHRLDTIAKKFTSSEEKLVVEAIERNVK
jgi:hypothetical protein